MPTFAERVDPTVTEPLIVGVGAVAKGVAGIVFGVLVLLVAAYPALVATTFTVMLAPPSAAAS